LKKESNSPPNHKQNHKKNPHHTQNTRDRDTRFMFRSKGRGYTCPRPTTRVQVHEKTLGIYEQIRDQIKKKNSKKAQGTGDAPSNQKLQRESKKKPKGSSRRIAFIRSGEGSHTEENHYANKIRNKLTFKMKKGWLEQNGLLGLSRRKRLEKFWLRERVFRKKKNEIWSGDTTLRVVT